MPNSTLHDFLDALPPEARAEIDTISTYRNVRPNGYLIRAGSRFEELYQIQTGCVKYSSLDSAGHEAVLIYMTRDDWVGLSEVFTDLPAHWDVVAQTPVRVRVVPRRKFEALVRKNPDLAMQLLRLFAQRFSVHRLFGLDHSAHSLKERLIKMLYFLSLSYEKESPNTASVMMSLSQDELSKVVGVSRQKLNPALKGLEREGLLQIKLGGLILHSRAQLAERYGNLLAATPSLSKEQDLSPR